MGGGGVGRAVEFPKVMDKCLESSEGCLKSKKIENHCSRL